jgi:hypothetical protein
MRWRGVGVGKGDHKEKLGRIFRRHLIERVAVNGDWRRL